MKKFIKSIPVYLTIAMILCCSFFVPAAAVSIEEISCCDVCSWDYAHLGGDVVEMPGVVAQNWSLSVGTYLISGRFSVLSTLDDDCLPIPPIVWYDESTCSYISVIDNQAESLTFVVTDDMVDESGVVQLNTNSEECDARVFRVVDDVSPDEDDSQPDIEPEPVKPDKGFFYQAFDIFADYIYGVGVELTAEQNMVLTILATVAVLFVVVVPFLIVYLVIKMFG